MQIATPDLHQATRRRTVKLESFRSFFILGTLAFFVFVFAVGGMFWAQKSYSVTSPVEHRRDRDANPLNEVELGVRQPPG